VKSSIAFLVQVDFSHYLSDYRGVVGVMVKMKLRLLACSTFCDRLFEFESTSQGCVPYYLLVQVDWPVFVYSVVMNWMVDESGKKFEKEGRWV